MAKQVIVLSRTYGDGVLTKGVVWVALPGSYQAISANPSFTSQYVLATSAELASIQVGSTAELYFQVEMPKSTTLAQQKTEFLHTASILTLTFLSSQAVSLQYYGVFWDGTTWSA